MSASSPVQQVPSEAEIQANGPLFVYPVVLAGLSWIIVYANHLLAAWQRRAFKTY